MTKIDASHNEPVQLLRYDALGHPAGVVWTDGIYRSRGDIGGMFLNRWWMLMNV